MADDLIALVGETASGKTALAIKLAQQFNGEIICADSRTVYRGLNVSTAKPSVEEQELIPHHLLDVVAPDEPFTVADFQSLAEEAISDIQTRGKMPILVGGTGLYVDAVLYGFQFSPAGSKRDADNPRHVASDVETHKSQLRPHALVLGLQVDREILLQRISARVEHMLAQGLVDEIKTVTQIYGWDHKAFLAPAFKAFKPYLEGEVSLEEASQRMITLDGQLAKRQRTWFKRNSDIHWISSAEQAFARADELLNKKQ